MSQSSVATILMLSANPKGSSFHRLEQEKRDIAEGLQRSRHRDQFRLEAKSAVRPRDLQRAMLDLNPQIVHFSGEGDAAAGLVFEDESGQPRSIAAAALAGLFSQFADRLQCVVLNACYSEAQAEAIAQHIDYVIGMSAAIDERAAIEFAVGFYDALGAGRDIQFAYQLGCSAAQLTGSDLKPVLKIQPTARSIAIVPTWVEQSELTKPLEVSHSPTDLIAVFDRLLKGEQTEAEIAQLRQSLTQVGGVLQLVSQEGESANIGQISGGEVQIGDREVQIGNREIQIGDRIYQGVDAETIKVLLQEVLQTQQPAAQAISLAENLPRSGVIELVGRDRALEELHRMLECNDRIVAISGMGGVGKTELALQYARKYKQTYQGGVCWLEASAIDLGAQIVQFGRSRLELDPPEELDLAEQVGFCWAHWPQGNVLIIFDNVTDYKTIQPYLPPSDPRFEALLTTRRRLGRSIMQLELAVLDESAALTLLELLVGVDRIQAEPAAAKALCGWLGYLPLGIELVGRYLDRKSDWSLDKMQKRLESKSLEDRSLQTPDEDMTARSGVATAFRLSWETLPNDAKSLGCLLSLLAPAPIPWLLIEQCFEDEDPEDIEELRDDLVNLHLLERKDSGLYQLHQLIREFIQEQRSCEFTQELDRLCESIVRFAEEMKEDSTQSIVMELSVYMPHIAEVATNLSDRLPDDKLIKPFESSGRFYEAQGFYDQAADWYEKCLDRVKARLGDEHLFVAISLSHLASIYRLQGRYAAAEPLYFQALEMRQRLIGNEDAGIAECLNDLAVIYDNQGRYTEAQLLCQQALEMRQRLLGAEHVDIAESLNNLALLYTNQGRYVEAEPLFSQALEMRDRLLGSDHPRVADSLNNLAYCYSTQQRYKEAESLYLKALDLAKQLFGENHLTTAIRLNNLADLYMLQDRYDEAEFMVTQALEIYKRLLGEEHPYIATSYRILAGLNGLQGSAEEAELLYLKSIDMGKRLLGEQHPDVGINITTLAQFYWRQDRFEEARSLYVQALEIFELQLGRDHLYSITVRGDLEQLLSSNL